MLRAVLRDSFIYGISNVASRAVSFILLPFYARILSPEDIGVLDLIQAVGSIVIFLCSLEINSAFARFSADCGSDAEKIKALTSTTWVSIVLSNGVGLLLVAMLPLQLWLEGSKLVKLSGYLHYAIMLWAATIIIYTSQNQLRWERRAQAYGALSFVLATVTVSFGYWQVVVLGAGINGALFSLICSTSITSLLGLIFVSKNLIARPSLPLWLEMAVYALPLLVGNLIMTITQQADRFLISGYISLDALGEYGIASRFASVIQIAISGFQMAIVPIIFAEHENKKTPGMISKATSAYATICGATVIGLALLAPELVTIAASTRYESIAPLVPVLALSIVIFNAYVLFPGLWIAKRTKLIAVINALYGIITILFLAAGIRTGGLMGVTFALVASNFIYISVNYYFSQKEYPIRYDWITLNISLVGVIISIVAVGTGLGFLPRLELLAVCGLAFIVLAWRRGFLIIRTNSISRRVS